MAGSRRARGEGSYRKLPSGLWQAIVKRDGIRYTATGETMAQAMQTLQQRLSRPGAELGASPSFTKFARDWLSSHRRLEQTTRDTYEAWLKSISSDPLGALPIHSITGPDIAAWTRRQTVAATTLRKRLGFIHQILRAAGNEARAKPPRSAQHQRRPLTPEEQAKIRAAFDGLDARLRLAILIAWEAGLRRSELCGLMHEDRDGDGIRIRRVVVVTKRAIVVKTRGKTPGATAWVPLSPALQELIGPPRSGYVLTSSKTPMNPKTLSDLMRDFVKSAQLDVPHMGLHALRRTFGMTLLESGADLKTAATAMRHDEMTLAREYARSRPDLMSQAIDRAFPKRSKPQGAA